MYTEPVIVYNPELDTRAYVKVFINGQRYRFYNGKPLGISCFPNQQANPAVKLRMLTALQFQLKKQLEKGWLPGSTAVPQPTRKLTLQEAIEIVLQEIQQEDISDRYRRDMRRIAAAFSTYLHANYMNKVLLQDTLPHMLENFLQTYATSGTYYMTQRSNLAGLFTRLVRKGLLGENIVYHTTAKRKVPQLNSCFTKDQLRAVLNCIERYNRKLYLCALLMYGCFLRPHREVRLLKRKHLNADCTTISLGGNENKSKRIRIIRLPKYVTQELVRQQVPTLDPAAYLVTESERECGPDYFKTLWTKVKRRLVQQQLVDPSHTLYSFRHTAAIAVYQKTKDPYKVQQLMFHSNLAVTLVYLRSLGLLIDNDLNDLPEL